MESIYLCILSSDKLYKVNISHGGIEEVESKSKYIDKVTVKICFAING